jgi:predicted N-acetyltransferase YhbS
MWDIRPEQVDDAAAIEALNDDGFGPGRYAKAAYRLRDGVNCDPDLSFVAIEDGILRGSIRFWPVNIGGTPALLLGPLAVQSDQRGRGIGISLMKRGIQEAGKRGHKAIILVGDAPYYARVGFTPIPPGRIRFPNPVNPARILGLSLSLGETALDTLSGDVCRPHIDNPVCADSTALA